MRVHFKEFTFAWFARLRAVPLPQEQAATFASQVGPERLISISQMSVWVVTVWYWDDGDSEVAAPTTLEKEERIQRLDGR